MYPDPPVKMETTSRNAFCFRPVPRPTAGEGHRLVASEGKADQTAKEAVALKSYDPNLDFERLGSRLT